MQRAANLEAFLSSPAGHYVIADKFSACWPRDDLRAIFSWSSHEREDIQALNRVMDVFIEPGLPRRLLVDQEFLTSTSPASYYSVVDYIVSRRERIARAISHVAAVRTDGFTGTLVTKVVSMFAQGRECRFFDTLGPALAWLGVEQEDEFVALAYELRPPSNSSDLVTQLRRMLVEAPDMPSIARAAKRLGVSQRTLQRRLNAAQTTFQLEACTAKLALAKALMLGGGLSMAAIASELGFASPQHFSARFRSVHGDSPSLWLRKQRSHAAVTSSLTAAQRVTGDEL